MLTPLKDIISFKTKNKLAWSHAWRYWYYKNYIHQGIKEYLQKHLISLKEEIGHLRIMDLGCGSAWVAKEFESLFDCYTGIDFNDQLIKQLVNDFKSSSKCEFFNYDIEENLEWPIDRCKPNTIIGNFIVLEIVDLESFFRKISSLQSKGDFLMLTGLDPLNELIRISKSIKTLEGRLTSYRNTESPLVLSKKMAFEGDDTNYKYYRILYSIEDITRIAISVGYEVADLNDKINRQSNSSKNPIYYGLKLKKQC